MHEYSAAVLRTAYCSDKVFFSVEVILMTSSVANYLVNVQLVAEEASNTTESFTELVAFCTLVSDEVNFQSEVSIVEQKPVSKTHGVDDFVFDASLGILEVLGVLLLRLTKELDSGLPIGGVFEFVPSVGDLFPQDHDLESSHSHGLDGVLHSKLYHASVHSDVIIELAKHLLLLDELHVSHAVSSKSDSLIEAIVRPVSYIKNAQDNVR